MEDRIEGYDIGGREFDDALNVGVFKLRQSVFSKESNKLDYLLEEGYNASIGKYRQRNSENGGAPINFSLDSVEEKSRNIDVIVNPFVSDATSGVQLKSDGTPKFKVRVLSPTLSAAVTSGTIPASASGLTKGFVQSLSTAPYTNFNPADSLIPLGSYGDVDLTTKVIGNIPGKLDRALDRIRNDRKFDISMIAEAGLGTINTYMDSSSGTNGFDDTKTTTQIEALRTSGDLDSSGGQARTAYMNVFNKFATFAGPAKEVVVVISYSLLTQFVS